MMSLKMLERGGIFGLALLLLAGVAQGTLIIDAFEYPLAGSGQTVCDPAVSPCGGAPSSSTYTAADPVLEQIIGGTRFMQVQRTVGTGLGTVKASAGGTNTMPDPDEPFSAYRFSSSAAVAGWGYTRWDGMTATPADLTQGGVNSFIQAQAVADLTGGYLAIVLTDADNNTAIVHQLVSTAGGANYTFPFANFAGVDPTRITQIELGVGGAGWTPTNRTAAPLNFDVTVLLLQSTTIVPEPGTMILGGLGLVGIGLLRRRRA
jgi:hypothetical protein